MLGGWWQRFIPIKVLRARLLLCYGFLVVIKKLKYATLLRFKDLCKELTEERKSLRKE